MIDIRLQIPPAMAATLANRPPARASAIAAGRVVQDEDGWFFTDEFKTPCKWFANCGWATDWARMDCDRWTCFDGG